MNTGRSHKKVDGVRKDLNTLSVTRGNEKVVLIKGFEKLVLKQDPVTQFSTVDGSSLVFLLARQI